MKDSENGLTMVTLEEQPGLDDLFFPQKERIWPGFMFYDVYADSRWHYLAEAFAAFQLYLLDGDGQPIAVGQTIPCRWDGTMADLPVGWADSLVRGVAGYEQGQQPNTLVALEIAIQPEYRGQGVSYRMVRGMRALAEKHGLQALIAAVRPSLKEQYPLTPMERYARWRREDGAPFDPWLRVHWRCGAEILKVANPSMVAEAPVYEWEQWTGLAFPESGEYVVPGALAPIHIDREMDVGSYIEPNVWVHHPLTTERLVQE